MGRPHIKGIREEGIRLYLNGHSTRECGELLGLNKATVAYWIAKAGIARHYIADIEKRFWSYVQKTDGCWIWQGAKIPSGYGFFRAFGKQQGAHRIAWQLVCGPIPGGLFVLHHCDTPLCVRASRDPKESHLFLGTQAENLIDRNNKGRAPSPESLCPKKWRRNHG